MRVIASFQHVNLLHCVLLLLCGHMSYADIFHDIRLAVDVRNRLENDTKRAFSDLVADFVVAKLVAWAAGVAGSGLLVIFVWHAVMI